MRERVKLWLQGLIVSALFVGGGIAVRWAITGEPRNRFGQVIRQEMVTNYPLETIAVALLGLVMGQLLYGRGGEAGE